ncbi:MAG: hypothetical protein A2086_04040 [Spirochaetes bacterium GWD1_27_9]|nr:MAG: hypothetical protein A2Z98_03190 [Spirochaetes bacterium GWB1_27_13]OHD24521.1 MAG: hypothetical protein A2Y34_03565 [Spirochaetes bacterium GWC1_27_15]OHD45145.1 MAG: hypothetical protein A2086_04040 [Spirochaetes bacterium GWD1_27_9]
MSPNILIVDDEKEILKIIPQFLQSAGFDRFDTATSYKEAIEKLKKTHFDIIVTDMVMEDEKSGLAIVSEFRDLSPLVIVITAYPNTNYLKECMRAGAYDYIDKRDEDAMEQLIKSINESLKTLKNKNLKNDRDAGFIENEYDNLYKQYKGKFIAILDENVIGSGDSYDDIEEQITKKYPYSSPTYFSFPDEGDSIG